MKFAVYDQEGAIRFTVENGNPATIPQEFSTCACAADVKPDTHYVSNGQIVTKAPLPAIDKTTVIANGSDVATVSGLPNPTKFAIPQILDFGEVTDGVLELTFDTPGQYKVFLDAGPAYLRSEVTIHAT